MDVKEQPDIPLWLQYALEELEVSERGKGAENPRILEYFNEVNHTGVEKDETPWCAAFIGAMLERSHIKSTKSLMARSYLNWGQKEREEKLGSVAILKRGNNEVFGHVGFVISSTKDQIQLLSGNQSNKVSIATFSKDQLIDLRWPLTETTTAQDAQKKENETTPKTGFQIALSHVLKVEGGWSNHKDDKGGPTYKGITLNAYQRAKRDGVLPHYNGNDIEALRKLTHNQISLIYETYYWKKAGCQYLSLPIAIALFDAAVNHGPGKAVKLLQSSIGAEVDGEVGPETISLANKKSLEVTLNNFISVRRTHYKQLKQFHIFGKGWLNRLSQTERIANCYLSNQSYPPENFNLPKRKVRVKMETETYNNKKWWGESLTVWGTIVTALSTILPVIGPFIGLDISAELIQQFGDTVAKLIQIIGGVTGTTMALYGRSRATTKLTRRSMEMKI
ncbi:MAG: TIGR02594 family protein [Rhodomicrobiaceae bacterium]